MRSCGLYGPIRKSICTYHVSPAKCVDHPQIVVVPSGLFPLSISFLSIVFLLIYHILSDNLLSNKSPAQAEHESAAIKLQYTASRRACTCNAARGDSTMRSFVRCFACTARRTTRVFLAETMHEKIDRENNTSQRPLVTAPSGSFFILSTI